MPKELIDDELWSLVEPLVPARASRNRQYAGQKPTPDRAVLTGILFVLCSGIAWNLLPQEMDGMRFGHWLLAKARGMAGSRSLATHPRNIAGRTASSRRNRPVTSAGGQFVDSRDAGGKKTGLNPTDRRKLRSKHHLIVDAKSIPLAVILSEANCHDATQLDALVDAIPHIRGRHGLPLRKLKIVQGDLGYSSEPHRQCLRMRGITPVLAKIGASHGSGLGKARWPVERSIAWLHSFRRLKIRYERYAQVHEAFLSLACALICWTRLKPIFN